ncbi:integral membrane protein [Penicillium brasilianum]|uniref:Integral membrane protein n=1 Tax=Penicillium brasilianum TaxID=104259 RepID=A0A1S9RF34_PENBI|nr:integral membrane protein [Penicillium brasilianum]
MGILKNALEPGAIAAIFTLGAWINRRHDRRGDNDPIRAPLLLDHDIDQERDTHGEPGEDTVTGASGPKRLSLQSRALARFPFLLEIWYWLLIYWIYQGARAISARVIANNEAIFSTAENHAIQLLFFENRLHIDIELPVQRFILSKAPGLMEILAVIYYSHIVLGVAFYVYSYTYLPRHRYQAIRRALALMNVIAFIILSFWRCAPPRLLPSDFGFVDVLHRGDSGSAWTRNKFQLTIAAMPSLHFGNSVFVAFCLVVFSPHVFLRVVAMLWPILMGWTVIATANHFVLDMVVGVVVVLVAYWLNRVMLIPLPVERALFRLMRLEKPRQRSGDNK